MQILRASSVVTDGFDDGRVRRQRPAFLLCAQDILAQQRAHPVAGERPCIPQRCPLRARRCGRSPGPVAKMISGFVSRARASAFSKTAGFSGLGGGALGKHPSGSSSPGTDSTCANPRQRQRATQAPAQRPSHAAVYRECAVRCPAPGTAPDAAQGPPLCRSIPHTASYRAGGPAPPCLIPAVSGGYPQTSRRMRSPYRSRGLLRP